MVNNIPLNGWPQLKDLEAVQPTLDRLDKIEAWKRTVKEETFTGDDITIENALALPARSLITFINAIQDLHGQSAPYVGGAGKNKLDASAVIQGTFDDPTSTSNCLSDYIPVTANTAYYMSGNSGYADGIYIRFYDASKVELDTSTRVTKYVVDFGFTVPSDAIYARIMWYKSGGLTPTNIVNALVQLEIGSSKTDFAPYSNICPISGRDSVIIIRSDGDEISEDFTIQLGQTVYGADINWDTGVATVDKGFQTLAGASGENWQTSGLSSNTYYIGLPNSVGYDESLLCNMGKRAATIVDVGDCLVNQYNNFIIKTTYESVSDFKAALANNPLQICYTLATPTTIQLTPTQLEMLKGYNRVTLSDGYGTIELKALTGANWS